ncbi:creatininase family protein [Cohnella sp. JJ-181]|uniref:creatininase family protein n=1 Tax=Cohnella rhizoplanae TaxID=2974897 RepID=UPI0022FF4FBE|nr:creatininase family protein [Cohnella sp. JJ-181]CAI6051851.1 Putative mycofactocin system creatinine amidohydrolase family protein MftE [Cohnella sp. JJ-181]
MLTIFHSKKDFEASDCRIAVLPVGATEQHGSHLPVGTDTIFAEHFSRRLAEELDAYLLPAIAISSSIEHRKGKGTVYLKSDTLALVLRDIAESLQYSGFTKLIIANFHGGNWIIKPTVRNLNRELGGLQTVLLYAGDVARPRYGEIFNHVQGDIHAGEMETSLMLHLHPEYVSDIKVQKNPVLFPQAYMDYFDVGELTADGYWGFPEEATAEKGSKVIELMLHEGLKYIEELERVTLEVKARHARETGQ